MDSTQAAGSPPFGLSQEDWDITKLLLKIGAVGTVLSIPVGIWAIKRWPDRPIVPAVILTGLGLAVKEYMLSHGEHAAPLSGELEAESQMAGYPRVPTY